MKRTKKTLALLLCLLMVACMLPISASAVDDYPAKYKNAPMDSIVDEWNFYNRECTSFCAWCLNSRNGVAFHNWYGGIRWGNANNWGNAAKQLGIRVDNTPSVGAIAWSTAGTYGHVAWVSAVNGNNVSIEEYNYGYNGTYHERTVAASSFTGYIHLNDNVKPTVTFEPWESSQGNTYIGETDASIGQRITVSGGTGTDTGMYLYDRNGNHLATGSNGFYNNIVYFKINEELHYTLTPGTLYKYKFYAVVNGETYWSNEGSFTTKDNPWLDINGLLDENNVGNIDGFGTCDVYINGKLEANDVSDYYKQWPSGTTYEIKDIKVVNGKAYGGLASGPRAGTLSGTTDVRLRFVTIPNDMGVTTSTKTWNGHTYIFVPRNSSWYAAKWYSEKLGGHLVTVTSVEEEKFLREFTGVTDLWIGATDKDQESNWKWITGEKFEYSNWAVNQPDNWTDNDEGGENYAHFYAGNNNAGWNDNAGYATTYFVCEIDSVPTIPVTSVTLDKTSLTLNKGDTATLTANVAPDNATDKTVTWKTSNANVATVADGVVTAVGSGTAVITAQAGDCIDECVVTVKTPLAITKQPQSVTAPSGQTASVIVEAQGDGLKYQWYIKNVGQSVFSKSSVTTNTYSVKMSASNNGRKIYCVITDKYGNDVSTNIATLSLSAGLTITKQPQSVTVPSGQTASVTVEAQGEGLKYQWYVKNVGQSVFGKSSVTTNTYTVQMSATSKGRQVYCVVTDKYGKSVTTDIVTLSMSAELKITKQPKNITVPSGQTASVTVEAQGEGLKYQWYVKNVGQSVFGKSSVTSNTYSVKMSATSKGRQIYCVVTDKNGKSVTSNTATLSMSAELKITKQPTDVTAAPGATATVTVTAQGDGLTYQWYVKNVGQSVFGKSSVTSNTYSVKMSASNDGRQLYCVVKDQYGNSVKSNVVTLHIG